MLASMSSLLVSAVLFVALALLQVRSVEDKTAASLFSGSRHTHAPFSLSLPSPLTHIPAFSAAAHG
jgi:hypothetical protein